MTWPAFFLGCFVIGFVLSAMSFAGSAFGVHFHMHLPFVHHVQVHGGPAVHASGGVPPVNFPTLMAFLAWFGGTGYLLTSEFGWLAVPAVVGAVLMGVVGSALVFWVMAHVLWSP